MSGIERIFSLESCDIPVEEILPKETLAHILSFLPFRNLQDTVGLNKNFKHLTLYVAKNFFAMAAIDLLSSAILSEAFPSATKKDLKANLNGRLSQTETLPDVLAAVGDEISSQLSCNTGENIRFFFRDSVDDSPQLRDFYRIAYKASRIKACQLVKTAQTLSVKAGRYRKFKEAGSLLIDAGYFRSALKVALKIKSESTRKPLLNEICRKALPSTLKGQIKFLWMLSKVNNSLATNAHTAYSTFVEYKEKFGITPLQAYCTPVNLSELTDSLELAMKIEDQKLRNSVVLYLIDQFQKINFKDVALIKFLQLLDTLKWEGVYQQRALHICSLVWLNFLPTQACKAFLTGMSDHNHKKEVFAHLFETFKWGQTEETQKNIDGCIVHIKGIDVSLDPSCIDAEITLTFDRANQFIHGAQSEDLVPSDNKRKHEEEKLDPTEPKDLEETSEPDPKRFKLIFQ